MTWAVVKSVQLVIYENSQEYLDHNLMSVVPFKPRVHCKDQNGKSDQDPMFSFASINRMELNKTFIVKETE